MKFYFRFRTIIRTIDYVLRILPNLGHPLFSEPSKRQENLRMLLLEAEAAVTSRCDGGFYGAVASGLRR